MLPRDRGKSGYAARVALQHRRSVSSSINNSLSLYRPQALSDTHFVRQGRRVREWD